MLTAPDLEDGLRAALGVERWVAAVADRGPFASLDELLAAANAEARTLSEAEVDEALGHHPRIGESATGDGAAAEFSRREQASADADDAAVNRAIALGNAAYEQRFGRVFLIRAAGRSRAEILAELRRRLDNPPGRELAEVGEQLRQIMELRLTAVFGGEPA